MFCGTMLYSFYVALALLFHHASFAEAQDLCRRTGISGITGSEQECGTLSVSMTSSIAGGRIVFREEMPWQAGIYTRRTQPFMQVCGGSIVSAQVVISAAHCFWNETLRQLPAADFAVAAGKLYRPWNDKMDINAQKSDVRKIHVPSRYHGATTNFQDDIALLIMATPFQMNAYIQPICLDFDYGLDRKHLADGNMGKVAGWGRTDENGKASPTLQVVNLPYVDIERCYDSVEPVFRPAITSDKICAGNNTGGTAACMGDSGGGLVFPENSTDGVRYFLRGVVSTAPKSINENLCNVYTYATFTHLIKHEHFIREVMTETTESVAQVLNQGPSISTRIDQPSAPSETQSLPLLSIPKPFYVPKKIMTGGKSKPKKAENNPFSGIVQSEQSVNNSRPQTDPDAEAEDTVKIIDYPKPKPLNKGTEDSSGDVFQSGRPQSDPDAEAEYTVKIIDDPKPLTKETEDSSSDVFQAGRPQSDPDAEAEYTIQIIDESLNTAAKPSTSSVPATQSEPSTEKIPYLSTPPRPYLSGPSLPVLPFQTPQPSETLTDSGVYQPPQSSEELPDSGVYQPPQSSEKLPDSGVYQPPQSSEKLPDSGVYQPPQSSEKLPDSAVYQPPQSSEKLSDSGVYQQPQSSEKQPGCGVYQPPQSSGTQPDSGVYQPPQSSGKLPNFGVYQPHQSSGKLPDSGVYQLPQSSGKLPDSGVYQLPQSSGKLPDSGVYQLPQSLEKLPNSGVYQPSKTQIDPNRKTHHSIVPSIQTTKQTKYPDPDSYYHMWHSHSPTSHNYPQYPKHHGFPYYEHSHDHHHHQHDHWDHPSTHHHETWHHYPYHHW